MLINKILQNKKYLLIIFPLIFILCNCNNKIRSVDFIIKESLHQAIALEKLRYSDSIFQNDSILIYPCKNIDNKLLKYDDILAEMLPNHIEKWKVKIMDEKYINRIKNIYDFQYIIIYLTKKNNKYRIDIIKNTVIPEDSDIILIDRARLTMIYYYKNDLWKLKEMYMWWG